MPAKKFTRDELVRIKTLLDLGWSCWAINKDLQPSKKTISEAYCTKLRKQKLLAEAGPIAPKKPPGRKPTFSGANAAKLKRQLNTTDPPVQKALAVRYACSTRTVRRGIASLGLRLVKKPKGHALTANTIEKRRRRSWPLYLRLRKDRWRKVITSDEAWVYLSDTGRKRSVQYISRDKSRREAEVKVHVANPRGIMVWVAMSASGVSRPLFIEPGAKINAEYYQQKVLRPFFSRDVTKMYPNDAYLFHQDSAPAHTAKSTIQWLKSHKVPFIPPEKWMPSSPDASPCDYFLWGHLKAELNKKAPRSVEGLKTAIADALRKIPLAMIQSAMRAWPKRCRLIYKAGGQHIEKYKK